MIIVNKEYIPYQFWLVENVAMFSWDQSQGTIKQSKATKKEMMEWGPVRYLQKKIILYGRYGGPKGSRMQIKIRTADKYITANENIEPQIKILLQIQKIHHWTQKNRARNYNPLLKI